MTGDDIAGDPLMGVQIETRLKASDSSVERAVNEAIDRLPENLKQVIRLYYLEQRLDTDCLEVLSLDRNAFHLHLTFAEQLLASAVCSD